MRWLVALLLLIGATPASADKRIALSFDDVPRSVGPFLTPDERAKRLIAGLRKARVKQAAFFVVPGNLAHPDGRGGERRIAAYVAAGHVIANHSFSHRHLSATSAADYLADIERADRWLRPQRGFRPWFRYPFLDEGRQDKAKRDAVRAGLARMGLHNGYASADGSDWNLEGLTIAAKATGRKIDMAALRDLYVETMVGAADYYDGLAQRTWGRQPAQVMLLHETDLAALFLSDLVKALRKGGWTIVTADEAYRDPIGGRAPDVPSANGTLTELAAWEKGVPAPRWYERNTPAVMKRLFDTRVAPEPAK